jgi:hypothetical protein
MQTAQIENARGGRFTCDTTLVLFFLAIDFGQSLSSFALDSVFSSLTLAMLVVLPYFLPSEGEKPHFANWLAGRTAIALFAMAVGFAFRQALGTVLPESLRFLPMTLLIAAAMFSCYLQFYGILKIRLAR